MSHENVTEQYAIDTAYTSSMQNACMNLITGLVHHDSLPGSVDGAPARCLGAHGFHSHWGHRLILLFVPLLLTSFFLLFLVCTNTSFSVVLSPDYRDHCYIKVAYFPFDLIASGFSHALSV